MEPFGTAWVAATLTLAAPLLLAAIGELISERAGVINIGLEGMMLAGAFFSFLTYWGTGSFWLGVAAGIAAGGALAAVMAFLSLTAKADQIVVGVGLGILSLGLTSFLFEQVFLSKPQVVLEVPKALAIPGLSAIPGVGQALFHQPLFVYVSWVVVAAAWWVLSHTTWGLAIRSAGETPAAADTAGVDVNRVRWIATLVAGCLGGLGGVVLCIGQVGLFVEQMSAGQGYIALAAVIFGAWRPLGVLVACLVFAGTTALQLQLQAQQGVPGSVWVAVALAGVAFLAWRLRQPGVRAWRSAASGGLVIAVGAGLAIARPSVSLPKELWLAVPYVVALLALAGFVGRARMPRALGTPYEREARKV
jgi:general nucleoside transport system permease protein